jgi:plasmid stabilization system protein ParE
MSFQVRVLARARQDLDGIVAYIAERSPEGAARLMARWVNPLIDLRPLSFLNCGIRQCAKHIPG